MHWSYARGPPTPASALTVAVGSQWHLPIPPGEWMHRHSMRPSSQHRPEPRLSVRSLWPWAKSGPSSEQGPLSSAYTPMLLVNTNAPLPPQSPSAA